MRTNALTLLVAIALAAMPSAFAATPATTVEDLFRIGQIQETTVSPDGRYIAYRSANKILAGNDAVGFEEIHSFSDNLYVIGIEWTGEDTFAVQTRSRVSGAWQLWVARLGTLADGTFGTLEEKRHDVAGYIEDPLVQSPEELVFARRVDDDEFTSSELFRIDAFEKTSRAFKRGNRIDTGKQKYFWYLPNADGAYVLGVRFVDGVPEVWRRAPGEKGWRKAWRGSAESEFRPVFLSTDGSSMWAVTNEFTDRNALVELDLDRQSLKRVYYEHERFDVKNVIFDHAHRLPLAAAYEEHGLIRYHFFAADEAERFDRIQKLFPDQEIVYTGRSEDDSVRLVYASTSDSRGHIHRCEFSRENCTLVAAVAPWLDDVSLNRSIALQVQSTDGLTVDAFLTLPQNSTEPVPLIALPHGGPIGVRDTRGFSAEVQWLALNGYAVLQVNYRGSEGYGKAFQNAGLREWGRGIEDDIEAAVNYVLNSYELIDPQRVGIFGSSYGGYSALMSVIRNPDLFKCAASFAGVTDLTLIFSASRVRKNPDLKALMARIVGHPDFNFDEQRKNSPVYRYKQIVRPVLLAHGTADERVDVEHSWRLRMLMKLNGGDPDFLILDGVGHGFDTVAEVAALYKPLVEFLDKHLKQ